MNKAYSTNDEDYIHTDAAGALEELADDGRLVEGAIYYEIDLVEALPEHYLQADLVLEIASDQILDEVGDAAEDAFDVSREAKNELDTLLKGWASKHITARYWRCAGKARELKVTAADVAKYAI